MDSGAPCAHGIGTLANGGARSVIAGTDVAGRTAVPEKNRVRRWAHDPYTLNGRNKSIP